MPRQRLLRSQISRREKTDRFPQGRPVCQAGRRQFREGRGDLRLAEDFARAALPAEDGRAGPAGGGV